MATTTPPKVQHWLDKAADSGLTATEKTATDESIRSWAISNDSPVDDTELWLYWNAGNQGGRLRIAHYRGPRLAGRRTSLAPWVTRRAAAIVLAGMAEAQERHLARQARAAEAEATEIADQDNVSDNDLAAAVLACRDTGNAGREAVYRRAQEIRSNREQAARTCAFPGDQEHDHATCEDVLAEEADPVVVLRETAGRFTLDEARAALGQVFAELSANAEQIGAALDSVPEESPGPAVAASGPTEPGWFQGRQRIILDGQEFTVSAILYGTDGRVSSIAIRSLALGSADIWYGDHRWALDGLDYLEGPNVGLPDEARRPWPASLRAALAGVQSVMVDQCLSGWALGRSAEDGHPAHVVVNVPDRTDPARHLSLITRYQPYRAKVTLRPSARYDRYPSILITPED